MRYDVPYRMHEISITDSCNGASAPGGVAAGPVTRSSEIFLWAGEHSWRMTLPAARRRYPNTYFKLPQHVRRIRDVLRSHGKRCYAVGGCLRNAVMGIEAVDVDLATDALPEEVMEYFTRVVPTGKKYGTVLIVMEGKGYEITTLRGEGNYLDGRRPEIVNFTTDIHDDLARRDFTMNALALDCATDEIIDDFGGMEDIAARVLRAVGDPVERFGEDGLRVMRAFRFMHYGRPDETLERAIDLCRDMLKKISQERITAEFMKILDYPDAAWILERMMQHRIFDIVAPELSAMEGLPDPVRGDTVWRHTVEVVQRLSETGANAELKLAALLHDVGKPRTAGHPENPAWADGREIHMSSPFPGPFPGHDKLGAGIAARILKDFKCSNKLVASTRLLVRNHMEPCRLRDAPIGALRKLKFSMGIHLEALMELSLANHEGLPGGREAEYAFRERMAAASVDLRARPLVSGSDIIRELGLSPGRRVGKIKQELFDLQLSEDIRSREKMLKILRKTDQY